MLVSIATVGWKAALGYPRFLTRFKAVDPNHILSVYSLAHAVLGTQVGKGYVMVGAGVVLMAIAGSAIWILRRRPPVTERTYAQLMIAAPLLASHAYLHDMTVLAMPVLVSANWLVEGGVRGSSRRVVLACVALLYVLPMFYWNPRPYVAVLLGFYVAFLWEICGAKRLLGARAREISVVTSQIGAVVWGMFVRVSVRGEKPDASGMHRTSWLSCSPICRGSFRMPRPSALSVASPSRSAVNGDGLRLGHREGLPFMDNDHGSHLLLAAIVDSCEDAILSKSLDGTIMSWNRAAERMFGYREEEVVGESILLIVPVELHDEEAEILRKIRNGERMEHHETVRLTKDGRRLDVMLTTSPVRDDEGKIVGSSKIMHDITERKRMERLLIQSEKLAATGRMAATIAHEINNPLESVMNLVYLARLRSDGNREVQDYLMTAEKEIDRVSHIAQQTLGYYRDTGKPYRMFIHELVDEVLRVYQLKFRTAGIDVECYFDDPYPVEVRRGEMLQVFSNIIANSIDAMPHGGVLRVEIEEGGVQERSCACVAIHDEGPGIERENLSRVFEPFFTTKANFGTGIGLWVAKQLIEKHGGRVSVTSSTEPGSSGTTVSICIPHCK